MLLSSLARCAVLLAVLAGWPAAAANLLSNGDFEAGLAGWNTNHGWYEAPAKSGLSAITLAAGEGRNGSAALRLQGAGNRGIAIQARAAYPGRYRVSGWIRATGLAGVTAGVLCEWMDHRNQWMRGDWVVEIKGDTEWQRFEQVVEAPANTRGVHFDLLTGAANRGTVWFDEVSMERVTTAGAPPPAPTVQVLAPADTAGELVVTWDPAGLPSTVVRLLVYAAQQPVEAVAETPPAAFADAATGEVRLTSLGLGETWRVAAVAVDAEGRPSPLGPSAAATTVAHQPPRPGFLTAERSAADRVRVGWSPHPLDTDLAAVEIVGADGAGLRRVDLGPVRQEARPLYQAEPWVSLEVAVPAGAAEVGVRTVAGSGRTSAVATAPVLPAPAAGALPGVLWSAPPTAQVAQDAPAPAAPQLTLDLLALRGESEGRQVMLGPTADLHEVRVRCGDLRQENGPGVIPARWLAWHFVNYVRIEQNSRATPAEELVWKGPADYPDELAADQHRDLPAGRVQPIYLRVTAPRDAAPGLYCGTVTVAAREGLQEVPLTLRVSPAELPSERRLTFVYWYSWDQACKQFRVDQHSADGWTVLSRLGELMRVHHQNSVVVPLGLIRVWQRTDGSLLYDWRDFDRYVRTFQAAGVDRLFSLSHVGSRETGEWDCPTMAAHDFSARRVDTAEPVQLKTLDLLPAAQAHVEELGLLDRFSVHVADEPTPKNIDSYKLLAAEVRQRAPKLRRIDAIHVPNLQGSLEIWVPQTNYFAQWLEEFQQAQAAGAELWFYVAWVPQGKWANRMIDSHAIKPRVLHWFNALYDTTGYLHWALNHWQYPLTSLVSPGDQYICWPSQRWVANSSLRYEAERDGMEEAELMLELRARLVAAGATPAAAKAKVAAITQAAVRGFEDYTRSWEELDAVRRQLIAELEATAR